MHCRICSSILGLYPLGANSTPPKFYQPKMTPHTAQYPVGVGGEMAVKGESGDKPSLSLFRTTAHRK